MAKKRSSAARSKGDRIEHDSMGELRVPGDALWGAQTQRAVQNFPISGRPMPRGFIRALGLVKGAAAEVNAGLGLLPKGIAATVQMASEHPVRALVLVAPFTSLVDRASEVAPWLQVRWLLRDVYDNAAKLPDLAMPVLIQHGTADTVVPVGHGSRLAALARQATFQPFAGLGHELTFQPASQLARLRWIERLEIR